MLKIEREEKKLVALDAASPGSLTERYDLSELIFNSPTEFFGEVGQSLFLVGRDVRVSEQLPTRIDILALDAAGQAVVIALPKANEPSALARVLAGAAMITEWKPADFLEGMSEGRVEELVTLLDVNLEEINRKQRAILIAESHAPDLLAASRWLKEKSGIEVICVQVFLATDRETQAEFLGLVNLSEVPQPEAPAPEPAEPDPAVSRGERRHHRRSHKYRAESLKLEYAGRALVAKLVDFSEGGLGIEMLGPLPHGSTVRISGQLHSADQAVDLHANARVAHCQYPENSVFRIGLEFQDGGIGKTKTAAAAQPDVPSTENGKPAEK